MCSRLYKAEDAVQGKADAFELASNALTDRLVKSWNDLINHEVSKLCERLEEGRSRLKGTIERLQAGKNQTAILSEADTESIRGRALGLCEELRDIAATMA